MAQDLSRVASPDPAEKSSPAPTDSIKICRPKKKKAYPSGGGGREHSNIIKPSGINQKINYLEFNI